jgi:hypothetical protein
MIEQIKQKANFLNKKSKWVYNWCFKNLPPEGIKIIEESFNNFLEKASFAANEPIEKIAQKIPINMVWKIRWLVEIARLPNDKTKMEAIKKIAQDPHGWKSKDVKKLCAMLKAIEKSLNPEIEKTKNSNNNSNKKLELICHLYNIDFTKIQHNKNKKLIVFLLLLFKDENAAKIFAFSSNELLNFLKKAMITEETLIRLTKDEIIALLLLSKKTQSKTASIIHSYKEDLNERNN